MIFHMPSVTHNLPQPVKISIPDFVNQVDRSELQQNGYSIFIALSWSTYSNTVEGKACPKHSWEATIAVFNNLTIRSTILKYIHRVMLSSKL